MEVKDLNKGKTGEAFEVILKQPALDVVAASSPLKALSPNKPRNTSLDVIKVKLDKAEERRKSQQYALVHQAKSEEEKVLKVKLKKEEADAQFQQMCEEQLKARMVISKENQMALLRSKVEKYRSMNLKPDQLREKVRREVEQMCNELDEKVQLKLEMSQKKREEQIKQQKEKFKEKENHAQRVRQNKLNHLSEDGAEELENKE